MQEKKREKSTTTVREKERRTTLPALPCLVAPGRERERQGPGERKGSRVEEREKPREERTKGARSFPSIS
jgi:hypothetical protein